MTRNPGLFAHVVVALAQGLGGASLVLLGVFLFQGPFRLLDLQLSDAVALGFDALLCFGFCVQHSAMVRPSFRRRLESVIPIRFHAAVYAIASGLALTLMLVLWQGVIPDLARLDGVARWLLRAIAALALLGMLWGVMSLGSFDPFGVRPLMTEGGAGDSTDMPLAIRGPYRWVRHPLYACVLLLLWACPDLSGDRLLLDIVWSVWVVLATTLEERDLVQRFGATYLEYQRKVPMLVPWHAPRP